MKHNRPEGYDYERDVRIDETALDVEWLEQASLALKYVRLVVYWNARVCVYQEKVKTIRSQLILAVNENPGGLMGKERPNAGDIEAYYRAHPKYIGAVEELNAALEEQEFAQLAKDEICYTRKKALESLVQLHGQQYFAGPSVPRDLTKEAAKRVGQRRADTKVGAAAAGMSRGKAKAADKE